MLPKQPPAPTRGRLRPSPLFGRHSSNSWSGPKCSRRATQARNP